MTWSDYGASYFAWGGTWDNTAHTFIVPPVTHFPAGIMDEITSGERLLFTDAATGQQAGVSFATVDPDTTFAASPLSPSDLAALMQTAEFEGRILWAWDLGTNATGEVLLSCPIGLGRDDVRSGTWTTGVGRRSRPT